MVYTVSLWAHGVWQLSEFVGTEVIDIIAYSDPGTLHIIDPHGTDTKYGALWFPPHLKRWVHYVIMPSPFAVKTNISSSPSTATAWTEIPSTHIRWEGLGFTLAFIFSVSCPLSVLSLDRVVLLFCSDLISQVQLITTHKVRVKQLNEEDF